MIFILESKLIFGRLFFKRFGNNERMRKNCVFTVALLLFLALSVLLLSSCDKKTASLETLQENCIRIHIRANSNDEFDQAVKLKVRDAVTNHLVTLLADCKTKRQAYALLENDKENIVKIADLTLKQSNCAYKTSIRLNNEYFPDRTYEDYEFPAGNYDALILELGSGKGDNWWCVAFPPLCFVPSGSGGDKIVYKSWVKETLEKLFG